MAQPDPAQARPAQMIPFNRPYSTGMEYEYIRQAISSGHISGDGAFTKKCQSLLEEITGCRRALLTTSCTDALEMTALLLNIRPGDEVIVPSFTFVSGANAYALRGARIVFSDIRPDTLNLDENGLEALIGPRTRAIVAVHFAGVGCAMETIGAIAERHGVPVVEDNAHGLFGRYRGRNLGSFGAMTTLSFHETKNVSCGEGGALLLNRDEDVERAEILREKGTDRSKFYRGLVDKYTWVDLGSSFLPSDVLAAFLYAQLEARATIQASRKRVWTCYNERLRDWAAANGVRRPEVPADCEQPYHMFYLVLPTPGARDALIAHLKSRDAMAVFHYLPLHLSPMGLRDGGRVGQCPVTEDISARLIRLPFYNGLDEADQARVVGAVLEFRP